jgi:hypothetical protein
MPAIFCLPVPLAFAIAKGVGRVFPTELLIKDCLGNQMTALAASVWLAAGFALVLLLYQIRLAHRGIGRSHNGNLGRARRSLDEGHASIESPADDTPGFDRQKFLHTFEGRGRTIFLMILGLLAFASSELCRTVCRWPLNPQCMPEVVGPGDRVCNYFPVAIDAVDGRWFGEITGHVANAQQLGLPDNALSVSTKDDVWAESMPDEAIMASLVSGQIVLPQAESYGRAELQLAFDAVIQYPQRVDRKIFQNAKVEFTHRQTLRTGTAYAGLIYAILLYGGQIVGVFIIFITATRLSEPTGQQPAKYNATIVTKLESRCDSTGDAPS